ncbi:MAG: diguanylate cyclase [Candidatus Bipolaricaulota bacterium]|nr:diguanylate cyclase [Candidatus Bipolaricaulota bacterium]
MTSTNDRRETEAAADSGTLGVSGPGGWARVRSRLRYGTSLQLKLIAPALVISCLVVGALFWFAFASLHSSIQSIYEQRARSVAALISKSIQEKDYILYYSDELDADIRKLLSQYESIVGITVIGATARGLVTVASTDPTAVGRLASEEEAERYESMSDVAVESVHSARRDFLRAVHPITSGIEKAGVVVVDMSLDEQAGYVRGLAWSFGVAAIAGFLLLGGLLHLVLTVLVTQPVRRLARAAVAITQRDYSVDIASTLRRTPGTPVRDEVCQLEDGFHFMSKVIQTHEQELRKLVLLDDVTGLYNVAHFQGQLGIELGKGRRYRHPTSLLVVDIGGLSDLDAADADRVRVRTANFLLSGLRRVDTVFRIGSDRMAALLPVTPLEGAWIAAGRLRVYSADVVSQFAFPVSLTVTSMGWEPDDDASAVAILHQLSAEKEDSPE